LHVPRFTPCRETLRAAPLALAPAEPRAQLLIAAINVSSIERFWARWNMTSEVPLFADV
jgi:hypothetical protein